MYSASFPSAEFPSSSTTTASSSSSSSSSSVMYPDSAQLNYYDNSATLYSHDAYNSTNSQLNHPALASSSSSQPGSSSLFGSMDSASLSSSSSSSSFDDDLPLLEELGINPKEIMQRTLLVSLPFPLPASLTSSSSSSSSSAASSDSDLAGPFCFCLALGALLLLNGKVHFGYIYGFGVVSCLVMYFVVNLMADAPISVEKTTSILGYALVPLVFLAAAVLFIDCRGLMGGAAAVLVILWCTVNATRLFESALHMREQRYLVAYPVAIIYACFALLTVF